MAVPGATRQPVLFKHTCQAAKATKFGGSAAPSLIGTAVAQCEHLEAATRSALAELAVAHGGWTADETHGLVMLPAQINLSAPPRVTLPWEHANAGWAMGADLLTPTVITFTRADDLEQAGYYPTADNSYVVDKRLFAALDRAAEPPYEAVLVFGPSGAGKTTGVRQWCAHRNRPLRELTLGERTSSADLIGGIGLEGGSTVYRPGAVEVLARPGGTLLLNEISAAQQREMVALWPFLERGRGEVEIVVEGRREVLPIHPTAVLVTTANERKSIHAEANGGQSYAQLRRLTTIRLEMTEQQLTAVSKALVDEALKPRTVDLGGGVSISVPDRSSAADEVGDYLLKMVDLAMKLHCTDGVSDLIEVCPEIVANAAVDAATPGVGMAEAVRRWFVWKGPDVFAQEEIAAAINSSGIIEGV